jgi:hypothetical protein
LLSPPGNPTAIARTFSCLVQRADPWNGIVRRGSNVATRRVLADLDPLYGEPTGMLLRLPPYASTTHTGSGLTIDPHSHQRARGGQVHMTAPDVDRPAPRILPTIRERGRALIADGQLFGHRAGPVQRLADDWDTTRSASAPGSTRTEYPQLQRVDVAHVLPSIHNVGDLVDYVLHQLDKTA